MLSTTLCYYTHFLKILTVAIFQILFVFPESTHYIVFVLLEIVSKDFQLLPPTEYEANVFLQGSDSLTHLSTTFRLVQIMSWASKTGLNELKMNENLLKIPENFLGFFQID